MSRSRALDLRIERSAVLAVERSLLDVDEVVTAQPSVDHGIDLLVFRPDPFAAVPLQVKGASVGIKVWKQYADLSVVTAYVIDPLDRAPLVAIMSGPEAWALPEEYVRRGGKASDYNPDGSDYRFPGVTKLLRQMLEEREATPDRWRQLFEAYALKDPRA